MALLCCDLAKAVVVDGRAFGWPVGLAMAMGLHGWVLGETMPSGIISSEADNQL